MIHPNDERYWLLATVDPATNEFLHVRLHPTGTIALTERFLRELRTEHGVDDALFLVDGTPWLQAALYRYDFRIHHVTHGKHITVERVFKEITRQTSSQIISATPWRNPPNRGCNPPPPSSGTS